MRRIQLCQLSGCRGTVCRRPFTRPGIKEAVAKMEELNVPRLEACTIKLDKEQWLSFSSHCFVSFPCPLLWGRSFQSQKRCTLLCWLGQLTARGHILFVRQSGFRHETE